MLDEQSDNSNNERRERTIDAVLRRIASAPPRVVVSAPPPRVWVNITAWRVPALAAAALLIVASGAVILKFDAQPPSPPPTLAGLPGALPAPLVRYLATGQVAPMEWLNAYGGRP